MGVGLRNSSTAMVKSTIKNFMICFSVNSMIIAKFSSQGSPQTVGQLSLGSQLGLLLLSKSSENGCYLDIT